MNQGVHPGDAAGGAQGPARTAASASRGIPGATPQRLASPCYEGVGRCTGTVIVGGAVAHSGPCPMHPEAKERQDAYNRGLRAGWAEAIAALRDHGDLQYRVASQYLVSLRREVSNG